MTWESCSVMLSRKRREDADRWRAWVQGDGNGNAGPMVGWEGILGFYTGHGWELVSVLPQSFGVDASGLYLNGAVAFFKRPVTREELLRRMREMGGSMVVARPE